jgi:hypothetical protein
MSVANVVTQKNRLLNPLQRRRVDDPFLIQDLVVHRLHLLCDIRVTDQKRSSMETSARQNVTLTLSKRKDSVLVLQARLKTR